MSCASQGQIDIEDIGKELIPRYKREKSNRFLFSSFEEERMVRFRG